MSRRNPSSAKPSLYIIRLPNAGVRQVIRFSKSHCAQYILCLVNLRAGAMAAFSPNTDYTGSPLFNWINNALVRVLLHISSLPSEHVGNFGSGAIRFLDFLQKTSFEVWQLCPLGPTGYGDSPYQCFSAFAGNPYFIDLEPLLADGLLTDDELEALRQLSSTSGMSRLCRNSQTLAYRRFCKAISHPFRITVI